MNIPTLKIIVFFLLGMVVGVLIGKTITEPEVKQPQVASQNSIDIAVIQGQLTAINGRYNNYGDRLDAIEYKLRIFDCEGGQCE